MTREEAIKRLKNMAWLYGSVEREQNIEAIDMAIEALQTEPPKAVPPSLADVYKWERDIALSQLEEYGIGFAEKKRDDLVEVVRCKDCRHAEHRKQMQNQVYCKRDKLSTFCAVRDEDDFCKYGERKEK